MFKILLIGIVLSLNISDSNAVRQDENSHNLTKSDSIIKINLKEDLKQDNRSEKMEKENLKECVGDKEFCNMTKEDYIAMLNDYIYPQTYEWILIGTHTAVFVIGLVGNTLVCVAVYRNHTMRTVTNYFLVNLAIADFMVLLFCLPATVLWDVTETWFLGNTLCKILLYFQSVSVTVSVLTLTFISVDRWYAICFPLKFKSTINRAKTAIIVIWTVSLLFNAPELIVLTTVKMVPLRFELEYLIQCTATWSSTSDLVWHIIKVVLIYTIPLTLMTVAYHQIVKVLWSAKKIPGQAESIKLASAEQTQLRSRRKAAKMLVAVVVMFAVCYFPVHLLSVLRYVLDMEQTDVITFMALISHVMCYANSAINPLIYNFMSGKYRREFRRAFCCSTILTHERLTTMSRLTTSKKKYEQNLDKPHKCERGSLKLQNNHLSRYDYGNASLKIQECDMTCHNHDRSLTNRDMPLKSYSCDQKRLGNHKTDHTSFNECDCGQKGHMALNCHKCDMKCHKCDMKCHKCDMMCHSRDMAFISQKRFNNNVCHNGCRKICL